MYNEVTRSTLNVKGVRDSPNPHLPTRLWSCQ